MGGVNLAALARRQYPGPSSWQSGNADSDARWQRPAPHGPPEIPKSLEPKSHPKLVEPIVTADSAKSDESDDGSLNFSPAHSPNGFQAGVSGPSIIFPAVVNPVLGNGLVDDEDESDDENDMTVRAGRVNQTSATMEQNDNPGVLVVQAADSSSDDEDDVPLTRQAQGPQAVDDSDDDREPDTLTVAAPVLKPVSALTHGAISTLSAANLEDTSSEDSDYKVPIDNLKGGSALQAPVAVTIPALADSGSTTSDEDDSDDDFPLANLHRPAAKAPAAAKAAPAVARPLDVADDSSDEDSDSDEPLPGMEFPTVVEALLSAKAPPIAVPLAGTTPASLMDDSSSDGDEDSDMGLSGTNSLAKTNVVPAVKASLATKAAPTAKAAPVVMGGSSDDSSDYSDDDSDDDSGDDLPMFSP